MTPQDYRALIQQRVSKAPHRIDILSKVLQKPEQHNSRVLYLSRPSQHYNTPTGFAAQALRNLRLPSDLIRQVEIDQAANVKAICVIENISPALILELGAAWNIDPDFFAEHTANPEHDSIWDHRKWDSDRHSTSQHVYGIYEYHDPSLNTDVVKAASRNYCERLIFKDEHWPINCATTVSYTNVSRTSTDIHLFLVDPVISHPSIMPNHPDFWNHVQLRFPYAGNRGGLLIPPLLSHDSSLFSALDKMLYWHPWQIDLILSKPKLFPGVPFLYLLALSTHETNLDNFSTELKHISFTKLRDPDLTTTNDLHNIRQHLSSLRAALAETRAYVPTNVSQFFEDLKASVPDNEYRQRFRRTPLERLSELLKYSDDLHRFILETFDILISTIAVLDSRESRRQTEESLKQTRQSILLSVLAIIYLPLSLATGVYGMNLKEMTGSGPHVWVFVVTTVALTAITGVTFGNLFRGEVWKWVRQSVSPP